MNIMKPYSFTDLRYGKIALHQGDDVVGANHIHKLTAERGHRLVEILLYALLRTEVFDEEVDRMELYSAAR